MLLLQEFLSLNVAISEILKGSQSRRLSMVVVFTSSCCSYRFWLALHCLLLSFASLTWVHHCHLQHEFRCPSHPVNGEIVKKKIKKN